MHSLNIYEHLPVSPAVHSLVYLLEGQAWFPLVLSTHHRHTVCSMTLYSIIQYQDIALDLLLIIRDRYLQD
jgi:hypothetical protein